MADVTQPTDNINIDARILGLGSDMDAEAKTRRGYAMQGWGIVDEPRRSPANLEATWELENELRNKGHFRSLDYWFTTDEFKNCLYECFNDPVNPPTAARKLYENHKLNFTFVDGVHPLHAMAHSDRFEMLAFYLLAGVGDLESQYGPSQFTPLKQAIACGAMGCIKVLLRFGASTEGLSDRYLAAIQKWSVPNRIIDSRIDEILGDV